MSDQMDIDDRSRGRERSPRRYDTRDRSRSPAPRGGYFGRPRRGGYRYREGGRPRGPPREHIYENSVFVGNLPYRTSWQDLKDCFRDVGEVLHADIMSYHGSSKGMGTVEFASRDLAQKAIQMFDRTEFMGREIFVREDQPPPADRGERGERGEGRTRGRGGRSFDRFERRPLPAVDGFEVFVGNLPFTTTSEEFQDIFKNTGDVKSAEVKMGRNGRSRGFGIIIYGNEDDAKKTIEAFDGQVIDGRTIQVRSGRASRGAPGEDVDARRGPEPSKNTDFVRGVVGDGAPSATLFVSNLPWETTQSDLFDLFGSIGTVNKAEIQYDNRNRASGNAIVELADEEGAANALAQLDGYEYGNRDLHISYAKRPEAHPAAPADAPEATQDVEMHDETAPADPEPQVDVLAAQPTDIQSQPANIPPQPADAQPQAAEPEEHIEE